MMKNTLKRLSIALFAVMVFVGLKVSIAQAGSLLDEMRVQDTCGTTYADKLATCTPFRCTRPSPMAMMFGFPSDAEISKMPTERQQKMRKMKAAAGKKMAAMSPQERAAMKARMTSVLEIKGYDAQRNCQTWTQTIPSQNMVCALDGTMRQRAADYTRLATNADHIQTSAKSHLENGRMVTKQTTVIDGKPVSNPWMDALNDGTCKILEKDADRGWVASDQLNRMAHIKLNLSEHGKHVAGHVRVLNSADGKVVFDKDVATDKARREINVDPGTYDIEISSKNPQLAPVWKRGIKFGKGNALEKDVEFYAITGTLKLTINVEGKPVNMAVYMHEAETHQWLVLKASTFGKKPSFYFKSSSIKLPETLTGKYEVFVTPVMHGFEPPAHATYKKFLLTIKNGDTVEKTVDFTLDESSTSGHAGSLTHSGRASSCFDRVQDKISWGYSATATHWSPSNIKRLCRGAEHSADPANCFDRVMHHGVSHGNGARWSWNEAIDLCEGTTDADKTIACFEQAIQNGSPLKQAIQRCGK